MRYFRRVLAALAVPAVVLTTLALVAPAASAGTVPAPVAQAQSQMGHRHGLRPEFFTIKIVNRGNENNPGKVNAFGPVRGYALDTENNNNVQGVFDFGNGNTVDVFHSDVSNVNPQLDLQSCTATATATGFWAFLGGTGIYRNALGAGQFFFKLQLIFKRDRWGNCRVNQNTQPKKVVINVSAWGKATTGRR